MESILAAFLVIITSIKRNHQNISLTFLQLLTTWMYIDLCNRLILMVKCLFILYATLYDIQYVTVSAKTLHVSMQILAYF